MKRIAIGFAVRLVVATLISALIVWLYITAFDRVPIPRDLHIAVVRVLNFPVAVAGGLTRYRGFEVWPESGSSWCCFCSPEYAIRSQMSVSIPTYLLLLYVPAAIRSSVRRLREKRHAESAERRSPLDPT
jgi:hypothetical protein